MSVHCPHCAHVMPCGLIEQVQAPHRGMWHAIVAYEQASNPAGEPTALGAEICRIADEQPEARAAFAQNTTRYDRPLGETV